MVQDAASRPTFPVGMLAATRIPHRLLRLGVPLGPLSLLETVGRRTGQPRTTPVVILRARGERWIVSPFGDTHWVHNVRAASDARLGRGARRQAVTLTEAPPALVPDLLATYRRRFGFIPFVRAAFASDADDGTETADVLATRHPVFLVTPGGSPSSADRSPSR